MNSINTLENNFMLLGEDWKGAPNNIDIKESHVWIYSIKEKDYFLEKIPSWYSLETSVYILNVDFHTVMIPEGFYILIADVNGRIDWINVNTIISRGFEAFIIPGTLDEGTWQILPMEVIGYEVDYYYYYPFLKSPITPLYVGNNKCMLISNKDMWSKTKNFDFPDFI